MAGHVRIWVGAGVAVVALIALGVYFAVVGLDKADKWGSVIGVFVAVAGLGVAVYGLVSSRRSGDDDGSETDRSPGTVSQRAEASGHGRVYQAGGDQTINDQ
ncbi:hypothetical protein GCM10010411_90470 [Actinomadura fulvescens]|uniref:Uncharacterized protein n=2 Tax=Actinomadura fulvescens TaxID=46160 RepID=A0ABP6DAW2_9ACTN